MNHLQIVITILKWDFILKIFIISVILIKVDETIFQRLNSKLSALMNQMKTQTVSNIDSSDETYKDKYNKLQLGNTNSNLNSLLNLINLNFILIAIENLSYISVNEIRTDLEKHFYQVLSLIL